MPIRRFVDDPDRPKPPPVEDAGQWVAWNQEQTEIVAHGHSLSEAFKAAKAADHPEAVLQKVPRPGVAFI